MSTLISNYTFSARSREIGTLESNRQAANFRLKGKNARAFTIVDGKLNILSAYIKPEIKWYDITIEASAAGEAISQDFRVVNDQFIKNRVIAHRGAWKNTGAAENSITSLQQAIKLGCHGSEFDVHMSADSVLVINHDPHIQGLAIDSSNAKDLARLKLTNGEKMPTLEQYLQEGIKQNTTKLVLEIKPTKNNERTLQLTQRVVELVNKMKAQAWVDYISFDYNICKEVLRLDPYARVAYLNGDKSPEVLAADKLWGFDYQFKVLQQNEPWIDQARQLGLTTNAWTVNDLEMLKWFLGKKVDFITTNEPEILLGLISK
jgi:glycerophosphoryl diester phosphodiesterase